MILEMIIVLFFKERQIKCTRNETDISLKQSWVSVLPSVNKKAGITLQ